MRLDQLSVGIVASESSLGRFLSFLGAADRRMLTNNTMIYYMLDCSLSFFSPADSRMLTKNTMIYFMIDVIDIYRQ